MHFGALLSNPGHDKYQISVQNSEAGTPASICLEPVSWPKKIMSIKVWSIPDLAVPGQNLRFYDKNVHYLRAMQVICVAWGSIHGELWLRS